MGIVRLCKTGCEQILGRGWALGGPKGGHRAVGPECAGIAGLGINFTLAANPRRLLLGITGVASEL